MPFAPPAASLSSGSLPSPHRDVGAGRPLTVFVNPHAGPSRDDRTALLDDIQRAFARHRCVVDIRAPAQEAFARAVLTEVARRPGAIVVGGGDGTVSTAAGAVAGTDTALGILPLGTFNHFAKDVGVPLELAGAVAAICDFATRQVDVAEVNGRVMLNNCSLGGYTEALRRREALCRHAGHRKRVAALLALAAVLRQVPRLRVTVEGQDWRVRLRVSFVMIVNNRYAEDALLSGRRVALDQGRLWVYASRAQDWRSLGRAAIEAWRLGIHQSSHVEWWDAPSVRLHASAASVPAAVDGELVQLDLPLHCRSRPGALRVIVPRPTAGADA